MQVDKLNAIVNGPNGTKLQLFGYDPTGPNITGTGEWLVYKLDDNGNRVGNVLRVTEDQINEWNE